MNWIGEYVLHNEKRLEKPVNLVESVFLKAFLKFALIGIVSTSVQYIILIIIVNFSDMTAFYASAVGYVSSSLLNYVMNRRITFDSQRSHAAALPRFLVVSVIGLALNTVVVWCMTVVANQHYLVAQLLATALVLLWNFQINRCWTFAGDK